MTAIFRSIKSLQATQDGGSSSASRFTSFGPACLISWLGILRHMQLSLKPPAIACKLFASVEAIGVAWFMIRSDIDMLRATTSPRDAEDWGTPAYYHRLYSSIAIVSLLAILVVIPNRWLVFSRTVFGPSLIIALLPLCLSLFLICSEFHVFSEKFFETLEGSVIMILLSAPWPLSLILSRVRLRRGETFTYA